MSKSEIGVQMVNSDAANSLDQLVSLLCLCCIAAMAYFAFTISPESPKQSNLLLPRQVAPCEMDQPGYFRGELYGTVQQNLDWKGGSMLCDGMTRPEGEGIRLIFSEQTNPDIPGLVFIIGLADAELGAPEIELEANVTVIDQTSGKFYGTKEQPRCWTRLTEQLRLTGTVDETWRINGSLYCASALAALVGPGSVTLGDIEYSGIMKPAPDIADY